MTRYSVQPRDRLFVKGCEFLSFAKNMVKHIGKNISQNLSGKCRSGMLSMRKKFLDHAKKSATEALKTSSKRVIQKTREATGDLIGNKIANKITKIFKKTYNKIIQKQYQMNMIKKYLKKDMYLQKKDNKLLIN